MGVDIRRHDSADEFRSIAEPLYRRDPILHTIELTLLAGDGFAEDSFLVTLWDDGMPVGAALQTPPYPLVCNGIPYTAIGSTVAALAGLRPDLDGVRGVRDTAIAFAEQWRATTGRDANVDTEERLYRLGTLFTPNGVAGAERLATDEDRVLLVDWIERFFVETFSHNRDDAAGEQFVDAAGRADHKFILWDVDGAPTSMAMLRVPAAGVSRIGPVFTPREQRGHGYGSAVTAAASRLAHRSGTPEVVLFADLANPTSNAVYQRIGFEPVADSVRINLLALD